MDSMGAHEIDMVMTKKSNLEVVLPENGHVSFLPRPTSPGSPLLYIYPCNKKAQSKRKTMYLLGVPMAPRYIPGHSAPPDSSTHSWVFITLLRHSTSLWPLGALLASLVPAGLAASLTLAGASFHSDNARMSMLTC